MLQYNGGKGSTFRQIINRLPAHDVYIEPFLGAGAVMRHKRPAALNIGCDLCQPILAAVAEAIVPGATTTDGGTMLDALTVWPGTVKPSQDSPQFHFAHVDAMQFLAVYPWSGSEVVYCDPPYLMSTRRSQRDLYDHELDRAGHIRLLELLKRLPCRVAISGYWSELYAQRLAGWYSISYQAQTRSGEVATEWLWMNYPEPAELHDYQWLGDNYRERERIKKKKTRWVNRFQNLDPLERHAIVWALRDSGVFHAG